MDRNMEKIITQFDNRITKCFDNIKESIRKEIQGDQLSFSLEKIQNQGNIVLSLILDVIVKKRYQEENYGASFCITFQSTPISSSIITSSDNYIFLTGDVSFGMYDTLYTFPHIMLLNNNVNDLCLKLIEIFEFGFLSAVPIVIERIKSIYLL